MESALEIKNLIPVVYIINAYEAINSSYGENYKIYSTNSNNEKIIVWSHSFLSSYINKMRTRHEFEIVVDFNNRINITGYSPITKLTPKISYKIINMLMNGYISKYS